ncbi:hypothetical protein AB0H60_25380 [Nocardia rhamnosiphila]|uniref:hypothetical protein n=1 Tax=Nocardia rhamnosiphila TaxID=426716 RepID=UPI0033F3E636
MAGDAPGCKEWGQAYDQSARETMQACTNLADALTNFGYVLYATGYNYGINGKANPAPPRPQIQEMTEHKVSIPTAVRDNGLGIDHHGGVQELFDALIARIMNEFGKLPNGDVDGLAKAAQTWQTFAGHDTVTGAAGRISAIVALFDPVQDKTNLQPILDHLETLRGGADQLVAATQNLATPVGDYHSGMVEVRGEIGRQITTTEWAVGITVVAAAAAAFFTWGASAAAAGGGVTMMVGNCINAIRSAYQASRLFKAVGLATAVAGAIGTVKAFDGVPDLGSTLTSLGAIIAMKVLIDDDATTDSTTHESTGPTDGQQVRDTVLSRTNKGRNKPHREIGTEQELVDLYKDLSREGTPSSLPNYKGEVKQLPDGTKIGLREESTSGGRTIDIYYPGKTKPVKVHLP